MKVEQHDPQPHYTPEAIDEIIARGGWHNLVKLSAAANSDPSVLKAIEQVCAPYVKGSDLFEPHHWFWVAWICEGRDEPARAPPLP